MKEGLRKGSDQGSSLKEVKGRMGTDGSTSHFPFAESVGISETGNSDSATTQFTIRVRKLRRTINYKSIAERTHEIGPNLVVTRWAEIEIALDPQIVRAPHFEHAEEWRDRSCRRFQKISAHDR